MPLYTVPSDIAAAMATFLSDEPPLPEAMQPAAGMEAKATRAGHRHPRLTSATVATLSTNGETTINFTRVFTSAPAVTCLLIEAADSQPVVFKVKSFIQDGGGNYTGCVIKGYRLMAMPGTVTLLGLVNLSLTSSTSANGAQFACIAVQVSS